MANIFKTVLTNGVRNISVGKVREALGISTTEVLKLRKGESANINSDKLLDFILDYMAHPQIIIDIKDKAQEQSKFMPEDNNGAYKNPSKLTTPMNIGNQEAREALEEQFKLLSEKSKNCELRVLHNITNAMLNIYTILYPYQEYSYEAVEKTAPEVPVQEQYVTLKIDSTEIAKVALNTFRKQQKQSNITINPV